MRSLDSARRPMRNADKAALSDGRVAASWAVAPGHGAGRCITSIHSSRFGWRCVEEQRRFSRPPPGFREIGFARPSRASGRSSITVSPLSTMDWRPSETTVEYGCGISGWNRETLLARCCVALGPPDQVGSLLVLTESLSEIAANGMPLSFRPCASDGTLFLY